LGGEWVVPKVGFQPERTSSSQRQDGSANHPERIVPDRVPWASAGVREIAFEIPERYNASEVLFESLALGRGDRVAVTGPAGLRTYAQLCAEASRWGNALSSLGLTRGDRVLLLLDDTPSYPAVFFGAVRAGFVPLLISPATPPDLLRFYLVDSGAKAAVCDAEFSDRLDHRATDGTRLGAVAITNGGRAADLAIQVKHAAGWLAAFPEQLPAADTHRDEMAFWMYSSGSTGKPKGIVHLQHDIAYTQRSYGRHVLKLQPHDVCFSASKIFFSYGFGNSISFPFAVGAASLLLPGSPKPAAILDAIARYRPTVFFGVPTLYAGLTRAPDLPDTDLSSIRLAVSAAEVLPTEVAARWQQLTAIEILDCVGATELLNVYISNTPERRKPGTVGLRVPGYEIMLKADDGREITGEGEGILWVRGHSAAPMYWNSPDQSATTVREGGWICTGDRFARDPEGFYAYRGRADDLVKISGQWVHPLEVQLCLAGHPDVRDCAVLALQLPDRSMTLTAFVVMSGASFDRDEARRMLQAYVKGRLLPHKYPRLIEFLSELPRTGTGKVDRQALRATLQDLKHDRDGRRVDDAGIRPRPPRTQEQDHAAPSPATFALGRS
jgi:benzoate-CoA ligase family protein